MPNVPTTRQQEPGYTAEAERIWAALEVHCDRVSALEISVNKRLHHVIMELNSSVHAIVEEALKVSTLSKEQVHILELMITHQQQSIALRRSIIEKSLTALIWAGIVACGIILKEYAVDHGLWKI